VRAVLSGATAALSGIAFQGWFNNIITMMTSTNPVVCTRGNVQEPRLYHHILGNEFDQITSLMIEATCLWGHECESNNYTCGKLYYIRNRGQGGVTITNQVWGPFR